MSQTALLFATQVLPDTPPPKKVLSMTEQPTQLSVPTLSQHELELMRLVPVSAISAAPLDSATSDPRPDCPKAGSDARQDTDTEEEHTLSAYGDLSLCEDSLPPPELPKGVSSPLQAKTPRSRFRLKVRRPPMPKRRLSYVRIAGPMPVTPGLNCDERWPHSPSPRTNRQPCYQQQLLLSPVSVKPPPSSKRDSGSSVEKLVNGLMPNSPSIHLSPPGSPTNQPVKLPPEVKPEVKPIPVIQHASPAPVPVPQGNKQKQGGGGWRTRLPPRPPIPKWDV